MVEELLLKSRIQETKFSSFLVTAAVTQEEEARRKDKRNRRCRRRAAARRLRSRPCNHFPRKMKELGKKRPRSFPPKLSHTLLASPLFRLCINWPSWKFISSFYMPRCTKPPPTDG